MEIRTLKVETETFLKKLKGVKFDVSIKNGILNLKLVDIHDKTFFYTREELLKYNSKVRFYPVNVDSFIINNKFDDMIISKINKFLACKNTYCIYELPATERVQHSNLINSRMLKLVKL
jgi:hypothetical protein